MSSSLASRASSHAAWCALIAAKIGSVVRASAADRANGAVASAIVTLRGVGMRACRFDTGWWRGAVVRSAPVTGLSDFGGGLRLRQPEHDEDRPDHGEGESRDGVHQSVTVCHGRSLGGRRPSFA